MTTPSTFTPFAVDPVQLTPTVATIKTIGANGGIVDYILLTNTGLKDFAKVWDRDISTGYNDETTDAASTGTADVTIFRTDAVVQADEFYVGSAAMFGSITFILSTVQVGGTTLEVAYGSTAGNPGTYTALTSAADNLVDGTTLLKNSGEITFNPPAGWVTTTPGGATAGYFIRIKMTAGTITTAPVGTQVRCGSQGAANATVYYVPSGGSVSDTTTLSKQFNVPADGRPVNVLKELAGRPFHMAASATLQALASQPQISIHVGGIDYA